MFWKRKHKVPKENPLQDKVARKIAGGFIWLQTKFADVMNKRFAGMQLKKLKLLLVAFCFLSGGVSIYFFVDAIVTKQKATFTVDPVQVPKHFDQSGDPTIEQELPADIYQQIQEYKQYMDSLGLPIRQGLQDSIKILEEIYLQQTR